MSKTRKQVNVRLSDGEMKVIDDVAQANRMSRSEVVRLAVMGELQRVNATRSKALTNEERAQALQMLAVMAENIATIRNANAKLGSNVNQIARALNSGVEPKVEIPVEKYEAFGEVFNERLEDVAKELNALWQSLV